MSNDLTQTIETYSKSAVESTLITAGNRLYYSKQMLSVLPDNNSNVTSLKAQQTQLESQFNMILKNPEGLGIAVLLPAIELQVYNVSELYKSMGSPKLAGTSLLDKLKEIPVWIWIVLITGFIFLRRK